MFINSIVKNVFAIASGNGDILHQFFRAELSPCFLP